MIVADPYRTPPRGHCDEEPEVVFRRSGFWEEGGLAIKWDDNSGFVEIGAWQNNGGARQWARADVQAVMRFRDALARVIGMAAKPTTPNRSDGDG